MTTFSEVYAVLRRKNRKNYALLVICDFLSVLLITAYAAMLRSPTVLTVLPEGGDSRKQMYLIFALAVIGCAVFTIYAASLFFRFKSREMGTFMALGAPKRLLRRALYRELAVLSLVSCGAGAALGMPAAAGIWRLFQLFLVDTEEMTLYFDPETALIAAGFAAFTILALFWMAARFIRRTNIIDIVNEQRRCERVRDVEPWFGPLGIVLVVAGGVMGYFAPMVCVLGLHFYPGGWINLFYLPLIAGVYMILLHTVVRGWRGGKNRYKDIITHSMMKFQGRQTVNNMLVMTVLIAGAYFASFYVPITGVGGMMGAKNLPFDYSFHYRQDQDIPGCDEILAMAGEENVRVTEYHEAEAVTLAVDGEAHVEEGRTWHAEYRELLTGKTFFSSSGFAALTGVETDIPRGKMRTFLNDDGTESIYGAGMDTSLVTNIVTGEQLSVEVTGTVNYTQYAGEGFILNDEDYAALAAGLPAEYRDTYVTFNVADCGASYPFAKRLFHEIVDRSNEDVEVFDAYNPVDRAIAVETEGSYWLDDDPSLRVDYDQRDASVFRLWWKYMPAFRILESNDFLTTMAVYLLLFAFVSVICFMAVILIGYTRCKTIALYNWQVYDDLRHLGASRAFLYRSVRGQVSKVYLIPAIVGTSVIYALFILILYANDGVLALSELLGLAAGGVVIAVLSGILWLSYRVTLRSVRKTLEL